MDKVTMTVTDAAAYIGCHPDTIYNMVRQKQIPHVRVRRKILFRRDALDAWMASQENQNWKSGEPA
jgi:excisionase family DNA binding protein